jgi:hypothetical protein
MLFEYVFCLKLNFQESHYFYIFNKLSTYNFENYTKIATLVHDV